MEMWTGAGIGLRGMGAAPLRKAPSIRSSLELRQASTQSCARCLQGLTACSIRCKATGSRTDVLLQSINSFRSYRQATRDRRKARLRIMIAPCSPLAHARSHTICDSHARLRRIPVCWAYGQATLILSGDVALETLPASTFSHPPVARCCFASACVDLSGSRPSRRLRLRWRLLSDHEPLDPARLVLEIEGELKRQDCSSGLRQSVPTGHRIDRGELRILVPVWPSYPPDRHRHGAVSDDAKRQSLELQLRPLRPSSILDHDRIVTYPAMVSGSPAREP